MFSMIWLVASVPANSGKKFERKRIGWDLEIETTYQMIYINERV